MRYKFLILTVLYCTLVNLQAQVEDPIEAPLQQQNVDSEEKLKTKLGVKFTAGSHTFKGSAFDNEKQLFGFGVGMYNIINLNKSKRLKFHWELNLTFKGSKFSKPTDTSTVFFSKISLSYAEVPVFVSFQLNKSKNPVHLLVGGQFGYLFKSSVTQGLGQYGEVLHNNLPFKKIDLSAALGLRAELGVGISMQFTTKYGLNNIYSGKFDPVITPDYKNVYPTFRNGTHDVHNLSFELAFLFGI